MRSWDAESIGGRGRVASGVRVSNNMDASSLRDPYKSNTHAIRGAVRRVRRTVALVRVDDLSAVEELLSRGVVFEEYPELGTIDGPA